MLTDEKRKVAETLKEFRGAHRYHQLDAHVRRLSSEVMSFIKHERVRNTVWLTAGVPYTAVHHYDPRRARFQDFDPFWEFVSGPLHAGSFGPNALDNTFGPELRYVKAPPAGQVNLPPSAGLQFFGEVQIDARSAALTVHLRDLAGASLWSTTLAPQRG